MKLVNSLQKDYQQLWKHIIRPPRSPYAESKLGAAVFQYQGMNVQRKDFCLTNSRGHEFTCSLWLPTNLDRSHCVIYLHGNSSNKLEGMQYLLKLAAEGLGLCTFDFSGCGNAEGEYISLGFYQQQDLQLVIDFLTIYPRIDKIAVWGRSMGAVTAFLCLPENKTVAAAVFDSPFKSFKGLVEDMANKATKVPGILLSAALRIVDKTIQEKAGFSLYSLNPLKNSAPYIEIPAFFIVGIEDEVIPIQHTSQLFQAYAGDDKIIKMVNGGHNDSRPEIIVKLIIEFLKSRLQDSRNVPASQPKKQNQTRQTLKSQQGQKEEEKVQDPLKEAEVQKLEQAVSKGQFSWSNIFSGFAKPQKQQTQPIQPTKKAQQTEKCLKAEKSNQAEPQNNDTKKLKKKKEKQQMRKSQFQATLQQKVREYSFCYL